MSDADDTKAEHKIAAAQANDKGVYEDTAFGRRRIGPMPKWVAALVRLLAIPLARVYRRRSGSDKT